jgi:predicted DNA-binding ribbon-helix-helix protein
LLILKVLKTLDTDFRRYVRDPMNLKKHSLTLRGHRTSISLEEIFWTQLRGIATARKQSLQQLIEAIDKTRTQTPQMGNLSSAIRVYVVETLLK